MMWAAPLGLVVFSLVANKNVAAASRDAALAAGAAGKAAQFAATKVDVRGRLPLVRDHAGGGPEHGQARSITSLDARRRVHGDGRFWARQQALGLAVPLLGSALEVAAAEARSLGDSARSAGPVLAHQSDRHGI